MGISNIPIKYLVTTHYPESHIQVCYIIGSTRGIIKKAEIKDDDEYYGQFIIESGEETFQKLSFLPDILIEIV